MRKNVLDFNIEALQPIVAMAASYGLQLVLENYRAPFDRAANFAALFAAVPGLQLHLDFGHAHFGHDNHEVFCRELGQHIHHVHFSDNRGRSDDHMPLGVGSVDWQNGVRALQATGYDGTITLEVFCNDPAIQEKYLDLNRKMVLDLWL